jgi:RNA polymerase sigma factor (sigma-70 family)
VTPLLSTAILRTQSDRRLVALAQAGHEVAFTAIVERYRSQLRRYCARLVPESRADDALQQAFLLAWRALQEGRPVRELRPWLYAIVHNAAVSQLRSGVFDYVELLDTLEGAHGTDADVERRSVMRQTLAAVAALPERQRDALLAVALQGRPQAEVAVAMGLTDNGLRQLLFRARTTVRGAATALTPIPALVWLLRGAAGAGAVAGGASAVPAGTALVVAGTLAVGGAVGLRTPTPRERAGATPAVAATPTAPPVASAAADRALRRGGVHVVHTTRAADAARPTRRRAASVVALRGHHGVRVAAAPTRTTVAPRPAAVAPLPALTPAAAPSTAMAPAAAEAPATAEAAVAPASAAPAPTAAAAADQPAAPSGEQAALPRAKPDDEDDGGRRDDDGNDDDRTSDPVEDDD